MTCIYQTVEGLAFSASPTVLISLNDDPGGSGLTIPSGSNRLAMTFHAVRDIEGGSDASLPTSVQLSSVQMTELGNHTFSYDANNWRSEHAVFYLLEEDFPADGTSISINENGSLGTNAFILLDGVDQNNPFRGSISTSEILATLSSGDMSFNSGQVSDCGVWFHNSPLGNTTEINNMTSPGYTLADNPAGQASYGLFYDIDISSLTSSWTGWDTVDNTLVCSTGIVIKRGIS